MKPTQGIYLGRANDQFESIKSHLNSTTLSVFDDPAASLSHVPRHKIDYLIIDQELEGLDVEKYIWLLKANSDISQAVILVLAEQTDREVNKKLLSIGVDDVFIAPVNAEILINRIQTIRGIKRMGSGKASNPQKFSFSIPLSKRLLDIAVAGGALLVLSPLMLLTAIFIRAESKGSVFYASKRVGTGFRIFDFYKFRSMDMNADTKIKDMQALNQYAANAGPATEVGVVHGFPVEDEFDGVLVNDDGMVEEDSFIEKSNAEKEISFVKIKDDPRITRVGRFIRNTSIDELPQLINVLKGDMSIVGNRPIPLYEAELLTTDDWIERFIAPAGLTGLWQVEKRGKSTEMLPAERKELDNWYAHSYNFWMDIRIIIRTFKALFQSETV